MRRAVRRVNLPRPRRTRRCSRHRPHDAFLWFIVPQRPVLLSLCVRRQEGAAVSEVVAELERRLLPRLAEAARQIERDFPPVGARPWSGPSGSLTDFQQDALLVHDEAHLVVRPVRVAHRLPGPHGRAGVLVPRHAGRPARQLGIGGQRLAPDHRAGVVQRVCCVEQPVGGVRDRPAGGPGPVFPGRNPSAF